MAPANFGAFSNDLLVGDLANSTLTAFNPKSGVSLGELDDVHGAPIAIQGLWPLVVGGNAAGVTNPNALYFTAGPNDQADGLFGYLLPAPPVTTPTPTHTPTRTSTHIATKTPTRTPLPVRTCRGSFCPLSL